MTTIRRGLPMVLLTLAPLAMSAPNIANTAHAAESATTASSSDNSHLAKKITPKSWRNISVDALPENIRNRTKVAVSNYPLYLLSQAVTKGAPDATLLLDPGDVGHHGSLSPGDMKNVRDSRYVVWFGNELESNLVKSLGGSANSISLFELNVFNRQPLRDVKGEPIKDTLDPHIWLDPDNAKAITRALGAIFSRANPQYKALYADNVRQFAQQMDEAVRQSQLKASTEQPYWAYHDAFHYIEPTLRLNMVGALTTDHHLPPKASQFHWLRQNRPKPKMCMVLQTDSNQGVLSKLKPVTSTIQQEDMSGSDDFLSGWRSLAQDINQCIGRG
ncbi:zinc ABC transporter substrate-binding protein [Psychrobacter sp. FDAARGOS_221]|nr:zinc ABC transporter substrate-binding protein [Psychrobacter sp. FDAARGOS_221]